MSYTLQKKNIKYRFNEVLIYEDEKLVSTVTLRPYHFYKDKKINFSDDLVPSYITFRIENNTIFGDVCCDKILINPELTEALINALIMLIKDNQYSIIITSTFTQELYDFYMNKFEYIEAECKSIAQYMQNANETIDNWNVDFTFIKDDLKDRTLVIVKNDKVDTYKNGNWINRDLELFKGLKDENT